VVERLPVERSRYGRVQEERLRLRREEKEAALPPVVQRFLAEPVTGEEEHAPSAVPDREGEHAA